MTQIINDQDYEKYKINIPFLQMFGRRRKRYVVQQLEKLHPCFSDRCSVDMKYGVTKKGLVSSVTVMDKYVLADYKSEYPGAKLQIEKGQTVYKKQNFLFVIPIIIFLFLILPLLSELGNKQPEIRKGLDIEEELLLPEIDLGKKSILSEFLEYEHCKIKQLSWSFDGINEVFSATVSECYPADFEMLQNNSSVSLSPVVISHNKPEFSFQINEIISGNAKSGFMETEVCERNLFSKRVRECLVENGFFMDSESYKPYKIQFSEKNRNMFFSEKFIENLLSISDQCGLFCNGIKISISENMRFNYELSYIEKSKDVFFENPLIKIPSSKELFIEQKVDLRKEKQEKKTNLTNNSGKKIGSITYSEGRKIDFYKNEKGKILDEEK
ncbi:MAG: hypothetical protein MJ182_04425 [Treponema sp.]|nr:hypothetical protein [Treponema sp.]